jgi:predicted nucleic-acid-binding Zn-ribbon protein
MRYSAAGARITCPCCQNDTFNLDYKLLNTSGASFLGFDWANKNAAILICKRCTHISWFMKEPTSDN